MTLQHRPFPVRAGPPPATSPRQRSGCMPFEVPVCPGRPIEGEGPALTVLVDVRGQRCPALDHETWFRKHFWSTLLLCDGNDRDNDAVEPPSTCCKCTAWHCGQPLSPNRRRACSVADMSVELEGRQKCACHFTPGIQRDRLTRMLATSFSAWLRVCGVEPVADARTRWHCMSEAIEAHTTAIHTSDPSNATPANSLDQCHTPAVLEVLTLNDGIVHESDDVLFCLSALTPTTCVHPAGSASHNNDVGSIQANCGVPLRRRLYYYEAVILDAGDRGCIAIGFAPLEFKIGRQPGCSPCASLRECSAVHEAPAQPYVPLRHRPWACAHGLVL